jgi:hypothetical protein
MSSEHMQQAIHALLENKPHQAIAELERLADEGHQSDAASCNRGLAYAMKATMDPAPGDLGRAVQGFEECHDLSTRAEVKRSAESAIVAIKREIARRYARTGTTVGVAPTRSIERVVARALPENAWAALALSSSLFLALGLAMMWRRRSPRVAAPLVFGATACLGMLLALTFVARSERVDRSEAVVVAEMAQPLDERHSVLAGEYPVPEGTRLLVLEESGAFVRVRLVGKDAWLPKRAILAIRP